MNSNCSTHDAKEIVSKSPKDRRCLWTSLRCDLETTFSMDLL